MKPNFTGDWTLDREKSEMGERDLEVVVAGDAGWVWVRFRSRTMATHVVMKRKVEFQGEERTFESRYTTDGKENVNEGFRGNSIKSKTRWEGTKLVTESVMETPNGTREIKEVRSLSADGKTMTVETTSKGGFGEGTRKLVYNKKE